MTLYQAEALSKIDRTKWFGPDLRLASEDMPFGGTVTLMNMQGDIMKVYGDGFVQIVTAFQIESLRK